MRRPAGRRDEAYGCLCERAAAACDAFGDDPTMRACAEACRRCAGAFRAIADDGWMAQTA